MLLRFFLADQRYTLWGQVKVPLRSRLKFNPSFLLTFVIIFAAPLQSALIHQLLPVLYKPRCLDAVAHGGNPQDRAASLYSLS